MQNVSCKSIFLRHNYYKLVENVVQMYSHTFTCTSSKEDVLSTQHRIEDSGLLFIQLTCWQRQDGLFARVGLHLEQSTQSQQYIRQVR